DWEKEKVILDKISIKFEEHKAELNPEKKKEIYKEIDKLSFEASKLAIPNELDKMVTSIGAQYTNAFTSNDQTVYINQIPSNELEKWMMLESERFQKLVMRIFHTELETVYEEFNISQDNDTRWAYQNLMLGLFENHPYGTQSTIGLSEHLKNPSMVNIQKYFDKYYVPNNIAICLSGDLDPDKTFELVKKHFGSWKSKPIEPFKEPKLPEITKPIVKENFGQQDESVYIGWRMPKANDKERYKAILMEYILANGVAGIMDIDLNQGQKIIGANCFTNFLHDHGFIALTGKPKQGQTLEEVRDLLMGAMDKLKKGDFDDKLIEASVNNLELKFIKSLESNQDRAFAFVNSFVDEVPWSEYVTMYSDMRKITKQELLDFANKQIRNENYVISYKRKGEQKNPKVEKPTITPIHLNRDVSDFAKNFMKIPSGELSPLFIDFKKEIQTEKIDHSTFHFIANKQNKYAKMYLIFPFGNKDDKTLGLMTSYLDFLANEKFSAQEFKKELYFLGIDVNYQVNHDYMYVFVSGLEDNLPKGLELVANHLNTCKIDKKAWENVVSDILKKRKDNQTNKNVCFSHLSTYTIYGSHNRFKNQLTEEELKSYDPQKLIDKAHDLLKHNLEVFLYAQDKSKVQPIIKSWIKSNPKPLTFKSSEKPYEYKDVTENTIYFYHFPEMVQAQISMNNMSNPFSKEGFTFNNLFNDYFGSGLSSIVFQELREQKALCYSAYSALMPPMDMDKNMVLRAYIGTQNDKMVTAFEEFNKLLNQMPKAEKQFEASKLSAIKQIASERIVNEDVFWTFFMNRKMKIDNDYRKGVYEGISKMSIDAFEQQFKEKISNKKFSIAIMGDESKLDLKSLEKYAKIVKVNTSEILP
ncbi:MAG: insulinase family protein, partial [Chitinophagales bacterium]|nr:insulinase family protein [Chitinophagales bacterium]